jgi:hypothetical protein
MQRIGVKGIHIAERDTQRADPEEWHRALRTSRSRCLSDANLGRLPASFLCYKSYGFQCERLDQLARRSVATLPGHGFHPLKAQLTLSNH